MSWRRSKCAVRECDTTLNKYPNRRLFSFPLKYTERFNKWIELLKDSRENIENKKNPLICNKHFEKNCFGKRKLKLNSYPTLFLNNDTDTGELESFLKDIRSNYELEKEPFPSGRTISSANTFSDNESVMELICDKQIDSEDEETSATKKSMKINVTHPIADEPLVEVVCKREIDFEEEGQTSSRERITINAMKSTEEEVSLCKKSASKELELLIVSTPNSVGSANSTGYKDIAKSQQQTKPPPPSPPPPPVMPTSSSAAIMGTNSSKNETIESSCGISEKPNDESEIMGAAWACEFKQLSSEQKIFAKKAIGDIFFEARLGTLKRNSVEINRPPCNC